MSKTAEKQPPTRLPVGNVKRKLPSGIPDMSLPLQLSEKIKEMFSDRNTSIL